MWRQIQTDAKELKPYSANEYTRPILVEILTAKWMLIFAEINWFTDDGYWKMDNGSICREDNTMLLGAPTDTMWTFGGRY